MSWRHNKTRALALTLGTVMAIGSLSWAEGPASSSGEGFTSNASPTEAADKIRRYAQELRHKQLTKATPTPALPGTPGPMTKRDGIFYFVSWSIPDKLLKGYMRDAYRLGATVVFRGMVDDNMRKTIDRTKALALELQKEAPHTTIDPVIFRQLGVTTVPTLAVVKDQAAVLVTGAASLDLLLNLLSRADGRLLPLQTWYEGQRRSWQMGGPVQEPRPVIPKLTGIRSVATDLSRYPIQENDMEQVIKEKIRQVDWPKVRQELNQRVVERLHAGPNLPLTPAVEARVFTVDITQRYDHDVLNQDGTAAVIKAGTEINPLAHVTLRHRYVIIDGGDPQQVAFAQRMMKQYGPLAVKVWLSAGDVAEVAKQLQRRVYWVQPEMVTKFHLAHVPSVISQNGPVLKIEEVAL